MRDSGALFIRSEDPDFMLPLESLRQGDQALGSKAVVVGEEYAHGLTDDAQPAREPSLVDGRAKAEDALVVLEALLVLGKR